MYTSYFNLLFKNIRSIPLQTAGTDLVAHVCFGYRHLLILSYTAPMVAETLGEEAKPVALVERMLQATDVLAGNLDHDMSAAERARNIVYLLHTLTFQFNPDHLKIAANAVEEFIQPASAAAAIPARLPDICKIHAYNYYFWQDEGSLALAREILDGWIAELDGNGNGNGHWKDLSLDEALERIETLLMYSDLVDHLLYEKQIRKVFSRYSKYPGIDREVRFLTLTAQMGCFASYSRTVDKIMPNVLDGKLSAGTYENIPMTGPADPLVQAIQFHLLALYMLENH